MKIAIIPARGGSERIPRKNIRPFFGRPIIGYAIETAHRSGLFNRVLVSTEDDEIAAIAMAEGATGIIHRPPELCLPHIGTQEVAHHAVIMEPPDDDPTTHVCCIYATTPLLRPQDLHTGYRILVGLNADFAFAVGTDPLVDAGQFYWGTKHAFRCNQPLYSERSAIIPIPPERVCDINTMEDWERAERMYEALPNARLPLPGRAV